MYSFWEDVKRDEQMALRSGLDSTQTCRTFVRVKRYIE